VVAKLKEKNIESIYHHYFQQLQAEENQATFFLHQNIQKPYLLAYCFTSEYLLKKVSFFVIGHHQN
jgi:hypothetical protein